jgi:uncharacterized protein YukJ
VIEMPLKNGYAILKGHAVGGVLAKAGTDHYAVHVVDEHVDYRIAINIRSSAPGFGKDLWFYLDEDFRHPVLDGLSQLPLGREVFGPCTSIQTRRQSGIALDFIRMNLFERTKMKLFPGQVSGKNNDLNERVDALVRDAIGDEDSLIYAFGEPWGPEGIKDKIFGFAPGNGVHDIHMNQGDLTGDYAHEDGVYQDGGLIFYDSVARKFTAYFTKFQSQAWHTNDQTGHAISGSGEDIPPGQGHGTPGHGGGNPIDPGHDPDLQVRIVAALVNPVGPAPEAETVTLLNTLPRPVSLAGWSLLDKEKHKMTLSGSIPKGGTLQVAVKAPMQLSNAGGIITLLNQHGVKVHGVSYTASQARQEGVTITF